MKAIIVDDERLARNELKRLLENFPSIDVVAEAANTSEAGPLIEEFQPDVLIQQANALALSGAMILKASE